MALLPLPSGVIFIALLSSGSGMLPERLLLTWPFEAVSSDPGAAAGFVVVPSSPDEATLLGLAATVGVSSGAPGLQLLSTLHRRSREGVTHSLFVGFALASYTVPAMELHTVYYRYLATKGTETSSLVKLSLSKLPQLGLHAWLH